MSEYFKDDEKYLNYFTGNLESLFDKRGYSKGDHLFKQGEVCRHIYYIKTGLARIYYTSDNGKEITAWFSPEGTFITALDSFSSNNSTKYNCEALEDLVVYVIPYSGLITILNNEKAVHFTFNILHEMARKMAEHIDSIKTHLPKGDTNL